ncbi:MAG: histidine phosphatase family protein [Pyrinomonadaceae bacterium]|nr:histidine phosphatase family protein [Pyrinomonadaceae bacterium]
MYLVRHGQAGTRDSYDSLSELGRRQSRLLGEYFLSQGIEFTAAYSGTMLRQQQTAAEVRTTYTEAALPFPEIEIDNQWNEFDLAQVYREIGPLLCDEDPEFHSQYEDMRREVRQSAGVHEAQVHRRWRPCDTKIVDAWIAGRFPYSGETWSQFYQRVAACRFKLSGPRDVNILAFTSATPAAILTGLALDINDGRVRELAGVVQNASYTLLRQRGEQLRLFQFNAVPHLTAPGLRTHR